MIEPVNVEHCTHARLTHGSGERKRTVSHTHRVCVCVSVCVTHTHCVCHTHTLSHTL